MKKILITIIILLFFPTATTFAVKVSSIYQVDLPVDSQLEDARTQVVKQGFIQVLTKVSGDPLIEGNQDIKDAIEKSGYYVQEFSYSAANTATSSYIIHIRFNPEDINRLLRRAGVAYWGENRPLILIWLAVTDAKNFTEIIGNETPGVVLDKIKQQGKRYGLPLIFPMMDVADISNVSADDINSEMLPVIKEASKRYKPDAILIGNIEPGVEYQSSWALILGDNQWSWDISDKSMEGVVDAALNQISQTLAKHYIAKEGSAERVWLKLEVTNITQRTDLAELLRYLKQLSSVQQIHLSQVTGDVVEISIQIRGSLAAFQQNAAIGQRLIFKSQDDANNKLIYDWVH